MKRQIHIDRLRFDTFLAILGGFAEEALSPAKNEQIRTLWYRGLIFREIAWRVELSEFSVRMRAYRMGLLRQKQRAWPKAELRMLMHMRAEGSTYTKIGRALGRSAAQCAARYHREIRLEQAKANKRSPLGQTMPQAKESAQEQTKRQQSRWLSLRAETGAGNLHRTSASVPRPMV